MEIKYTTDGKKVVVVGSLNQTESIVQEIFVTEDGAEIPSGERFVVKSLHDAPVESWNTRECKRIKDRLNALKKNLANETDRVYKAMKHAEKKAASLFRFEKHADIEQLKTLIDFVSGKITHVFINSYRPEIKTFDEAIETDYKYDRELKLLSLFGKSDGTLDWRIHRYSDSTLNGHTVYPAHSLEHANEIAQEHYDKEIDKWRNGDSKCPPALNWLSGKLGEIAIPDDVKEYHKQRKIDEIKGKIAAANKNLSELKDKLAEAENIPF